MPAISGPPTFGFVFDSMKFRSLPGAIAIAILTVVIAPANVSAQSGCCTVRGNCDCDPSGVVDIADLTRLIDNMFISLEPLCCPEAGNIDADPVGLVDIADLTRLIDNMFISLAPLDPCATGGLTFAQREVVFNALDSVAATIEGAPADSVAGKLAAFLASRPEIDSAGIIDGISVWAWFTDGRIISIPNNREPTGSAVNSAEWPEVTDDTVLPPNFTLPPRRFPAWDGQAELPVASTSLSAVNFELPNSIQARVLSTLGSGCFTIGAPIVKKLLEDHGYVAASASATVPALFGVNGDGLFYIDAHGGSCPSTTGVNMLAVWTATTVTPARDSVYASPLAQNELVYMSARDRDPSSGTCRAHWRYAFTGKFVAQYMKFVPNSIIIINACQTDSVSSLRQGFAAAGASVFCGWSKVVNDFGANRAAEFLIDRMLGANQSTMTAKESPPQRPFDIDPLYLDMVSRSFDTDPAAPNAKIRVRRLGGNFGLLAPSIAYMSIGEEGDTLSLVGMFGTDPGDAGRVIVGGSELPILTWEPTHIVANIPNSGAGSCGPVHVEVDGITGPSYSVKRKSNVVNLTEWRGVFTHTEKNDGTLLATIPLDLHIRADIHKYREVPHAAPIANTVLFDGAQDSHADVTAGGEFTIYFPPPPEPGGWIKYVWSGTATIPGPWENTENGLNIYGSINTLTRATELHLSGTSNPGCEMQITTSAGINNTVPMTYGLTLGVFDDQIWQKLFLTLDNTWSIPANHRENSECCGYGGGNTTYRLEWPLIQASFPPDSTAAQ